MDNAIKIGIVWFLVFAVIAGGVTAFRHELTVWFLGYLFIDGASAYLLTTSIRDAARPSQRP
jgi:hypothetical protein